jgi:hypothetical protein
MIKKRVGKCWKANKLCLEENEVVTFDMSFVN